MANPSVPRIGKPCRQCGVVFRAVSNNKRQVFCGRRCAALARPRASRVAAGRKGGLAGSEKRRGLRVSQIRSRVAALTPFAAFADGVKWGQRRLASRVQSARREGFSRGFEQGYDEAMKALQLGRTA